MEKELFYKEIQDAEMVLVGLGDEFDSRKQLLLNPKYVEIENLLKEHQMEWLLPKVQAYFRENMQIQLTERFEKLKDILKEKNYFIISTSTAEEITKIAWKRNNLVMPLGFAGKLQCKEECDILPTDLSEQDTNLVDKVVRDLVENKILPAEDALGVCFECNTPKKLNSIYCYEQYDERGYFEEWKRYSNWLQVTLNRKLFILEIGVSLQYPSVIRFPFEKIASLNQKSVLCRVNDNLYQLPDGLANKGYSIHDNGIAWIDSL